MLSAEYDRALSEAKLHHANSKTYSGKLLRPHAIYIEEVIRRLGCKTALDYGCGKGSQYVWRNHAAIDREPDRDGRQFRPFLAGQSLEDYWRLPVTKFDPAYPPFAAEPVGVFDLVICTHTLGAIPTADLDTIIDRLFSLATKAVYIAEKIGETRKQVFSKPHLFPRDWTAEQWADRIRARPHAGLEVTLSTRGVTPEGINSPKVRL